MWLLCSSISCMLCRIACCGYVCTWGRLGTPNSLYCCCCYYYYVCLCAEDQLEVEYTSPEKCVGQYSHKNVTSIITFSCDRNVDHVRSLETALPLFSPKDPETLISPTSSGQGAPLFHHFFLQVQSKQSDSDCLDCVFNIVRSCFAKCLWLFRQGLSLLWDPSDPSCKDGNKCKKGCAFAANWWQICTRRTQ